MISCSNMFCGGGLCLPVVLNEPVCAAGSKSSSNVCPPNSANVRIFDVISRERVKNFFSGMDCKSACGECGGNTVRHDGENLRK